MRLAFWGRRAFTRTRSVQATRLFLERLENRNVLATLKVGGSGAFSTITDAVAAAQDGDTVKVVAGDYRSEGVITIDKTIEIKGAQANVDARHGRTAGGPKESIVAGFDLQANKVKIIGFTIANDSGDGIETSTDFSGYKIKKNIFSGNDQAGICLFSDGVFKTVIGRNWFNNLDSGLGAELWDIRNLGDGPLSNVVIRQNKFSDPTRDDAAINLQCTDMPFDKIKIVCNKFVHSNGVILWSAENSVIAHNIMKDYVGTGVSLSLELNNVRVVCNTLRAGEDAEDAVHVELASGTSTGKPNLVIAHNWIKGGTGSEPGGNGEDGIDVNDTDAGFIVKIAGNHIRHMGNVGIQLRAGVTGAIVKWNRVTYSGSDGINLDNADENVVKHNTSKHNAGAGIFLTNSDDNTVKKNRTNHNDYGIFVNSQSTGNTLLRNSAFHNTTFDFNDNSVGAGTANTANTWTDNHGETASPPGLIS